MVESKTGSGGCSGGLLGRGSQRPLGARVEGGVTTFRLFAPRASRVTLVLFRHLDAPEPTALVLERLDDGVRETQHPGDLHGWYYYQVDGRNRGPFTHFNRDFRVLDPNALAAVGPAGPGIV